METMPLVTVIVAVYNVEKYIEKCIQSICQQTYPKLEILVIDDCSTDTSRRICERYAAVDDRIRIIHHTTNQGISNVRNAGMKAAKGDYYLFVDGDDYIAKELCENAVAALQQRPETDTVHWGYYCVDEEGEVLSEENAILQEQSFIRQEDIFDHVLGTLLVSMDDLYYWFSHKQSYYEAIHSKKQMAAVWRFLLSAEVVRSNHLSFPRGVDRGEDIVFLLEYLQCVGQIANLTQKGYYYVQRNASLSRDNTNIENKLKLMEAMDQTVLYAPAGRQEELKNMWRGQRILITMNSARLLAANNRLRQGYREFQKLARHYDSRDAYRSIRLRGIPWKYRIAIGLIKYKRFFLFYLCIYMMKKLHMDMAPMG